jgi:hypothetical protein
MYSPNGGYAIYFLKAHFNQFINFELCMYSLNGRYAKYFFIKPISASTSTSSSTCTEGRPTNNPNIQQINLYCTSASHPASKPTLDAHTAFNFAAHKCLVVGLGQGARLVLGPDLTDLRTLRKRPNGGGGNQGQLQRPLLVHNALVEQAGPVGGVDAGAEQFSNTQLHRLAVDQRRSVRGVGKRKF